MTAEYSVQERKNMRFKTLTLAAGAAALVAAPVAIQAQVADRAAAPVDGESELAGQGTIIGVIALAVLAGFIALTASDDDDLPVSP